MILNKKGLTIAEAVISMMLLAIVTMGIYGVIMTSVRSAKKPEMREDMAFAIEQVTARLKSNIQQDVFCRELNADGTACRLYDVDCHTPNRYFDELTQEYKYICGTPAWADYYGIVGGQPVFTVPNSSNIIDQILNNRTQYDMCNKVLPNADSKEAGTDIISDVRNPWTPGIDYHIDCMLPQGCPDGVFFYNVTPDSYGNRTISFQLECNGEAV
ncbi:hypothetical protein AAIR98_001000 [Elusimicrobium simillimum]|uniref:type IV pilus modification PilV family protein n=1 Tax=Elusimicrobium simillimum TaxID=3143438 RepID=UPI003C6FCB55